VFGAIAMGHISIRLFDRVRLLEILKPRLFVELYTYMMRAEAKELIRERTVKTFNAIMLAVLLQM
jgi:hypothetical protein